MTDLYNGQITDLLNNAYRYDPEVIAFSYAILQEKRRIMQELAQTRTMSVIDDLPESILDVLAVELRTPYYVDSLSVDAKREIIKKSFLWAARAGTVSAVEELIQAVFGEGDVVEWPDFTEEPREPGTFDIVTSGQLTPDAATFFTRVVKRVKNVRSHIRRILIERHEKMQMYAAAGSLSEPHRPVLNHHKSMASGSLQELTAAAIAAAPSAAITNHPQGRTGNADLVETSAAAMAAAPAAHIYNHTPTRTTAAQGAVFIPAGGFSAPSTNILNHAASRQRGNAAAQTVTSAFFVESRTVRILNNFNNVELKAPRCAECPGSRRSQFTHHHSLTGGTTMAGIFKESVLTKKGIALLAKAQAGRCTIKLTKAAAGDGSYTSGEDLTTRTALKSQKQTFPLTTTTVQNATNVFVKFIMSNHQDSGDLKNGYYVKEIGIFATDPDEGEILYALAIAETDQWDYMPAFNDLLPSTITIDFLLEVSNATDVTIQMPNKQYAYDDTTGKKYIIGIDNGLIYFQEVTE